MTADSILIIKTGALGDVLRTTSILPGLKQRYPGACIEWVTAPAAYDLVAAHPDLTAVHLVSPKDAAAVAALGDELVGRDWSHVISLDDEEPLCRLASSMKSTQLSGAHLDEDGARVYSADVAPWFDMGLLSVHGKQVADRMKVKNKRSHAAIYADMLDVSMGRPTLPLPEASTLLARDFYARCKIADGSQLIGLNTGAGGRWTSKQLGVGVVASFAGQLAAQTRRPAHFVVLGGPEEAERNRELCAVLARTPGVEFCDAGVDNSMLDFAALVGGLDLLLTSDSLALHIAVAREISLVAFFAPTSAAEIELFGLGEKVQSTAPDYCSYKRDADTLSLTPERLVAASLRVLAG